MKSYNEFAFEARICLTNGIHIFTFWFFGRKGVLHFRVWTYISPSRFLGPSVSLSCRCAATYYGHKVGCPPNDLAVMERVYNADKLITRDTFFFGNLVSLPGMEPEYTVLISPQHELIGRVPKFAYIPQVSAIYLRFEVHIQPTA
jgi:hypothetical protein